MMAATKLRGWIALDAASEIVGHAATESELIATLGHVEGISYFACHHFEEPLPAERVGTRIAHGHFELKLARSFPEAPRAATARLTGPLRSLLLAVVNIAPYSRIPGRAPVWALAGWTGRTESATLDALETLCRRGLVSPLRGHDPAVSVTPLGRQVARLAMAWRNV
jgi:hypothetical protein